MLDIEAGEEILYVGDHLYADVLRSKRALGWRSCFIMPELPDEMRIFQNQLGLRKSIMELRKLREEFSQYSDLLTLGFSNLFMPTAFRKVKNHIKKINQAGISHILIGNLTKLENRRFWLLCDISFSRTQCFPKFQDHPGPIN